MAIIDEEILTLSEIDLKAKADTVKYTYEYKVKTGLTPKIPETEEEKNYADFQKLNNHSVVKEKRQKNKITLSHILCELFNLTPCECYIQDWDDFFTTNTLSSIPDNQVAEFPLVFEKRMPEEKLYLFKAQLEMVGLDVEVRDDCPETFKHHPLFHKPKTLVFKNTLNELFEKLTDAQRVLQEDLRTHGLK